MERTSFPRNFLPQVLADIIRDFLEIACQLAETEQAYLMRELEQTSVSSEGIEVHPAFSVDGKVIIIGNKSASECWLYSPETGKILKIKCRRD